MRRWKSSGAWRCRDVFKPVDLKDAMEKERIKGLIVFGEDPLSATSNLKLTSGAEFMVVVDSFMTATAMEADVLLPGLAAYRDRRHLHGVRSQGASDGQDIRAQDRHGKPADPGGPGGKNAHSPDARGREPISARRSKRLFLSMESLRREGSGARGLLDESFMTPSGKGRFAAFEPDATPYSGEKMRYLFDENYFRLNIKGKLTA